MLFLLPHQDHDVVEGGTVDDDAVPKPASGLLNARGQCLETVIADAHSLEELAGLRVEDFVPTLDDPPAGHHVVFGTREDEAPVPQESHEVSGLLQV